MLQERTLENTGNSARHWLVLGQRHGIVTPDGKGPEYVLYDLVGRTPDVIQSVQAMLPEGFPDRLAASIMVGITKAADKLATA